MISKKKVNVLENVNVKVNGNHEVITCIYSKERPSFASTVSLIQNINTKETSACLGLSLVVI